MTSSVEPAAAPEVQVLGDAVVLRGLAALAAEAVVKTGIRAGRVWDGIEPSRAVLEVLAGVSVAAARSRSTSTSSTSPTCRSQPTSAASSARRVIGSEEAAAMFGLSPRTVVLRAADLGGWRSSRRGRPWVFDADVIRTHLDAKDT